MDEKKKEIERKRKEKKVMRNRDVKKKRER